VPAFSDKQAIVLLEAVRVALANLRDAEGAAADARMYAMQAAIPITLAAVEDIDREVAAAAERVRRLDSWGDGCGRGGCRQQPPPILHGCASLSSTSQCTSLPTRLS
jgi:hypothetical protein